MNIPERVDGMGNLTDGELVARVRQGNQEAFSELISRYYGMRMISCRRLRWDYWIA